MKLKLTTISKFIIGLAGLAALAVCVILLPELAREEALENPGTATLNFPFLLGAWVLSVPFFVALFQTFKLLTLIDTGKAFSGRAVKALGIIKACAVTFSLLIVLGVIGGISWIRSIDPREDVTAFVSLGFIFAFTAVVIATFVAVLQRLLQNAIAIKSENDLTI